MKKFFGAARYKWRFFVFILLPLAYCGPEFASIVHSGYFNNDDISNIYWGRVTSYGNIMLGHFNPASEVFRPAGLLWYRLIGNTSGVNPLPFHLFQTLLNLFNAVLVYVFIRQLTRSHFAAALVSSLWISSLALIETRWWFGSIFDVLYTTYLLAALILFCRNTRLAIRLPAILLLFMFAFRSKESAVILPALMLAYAVLVRLFDLQFWRSRWPDMVASAMMGIVFFIVRYPAMATPHDPSSVYYFDFRLEVLINTCVWYLRELLPGQKQAHQLTIALVIALAVALSFALRDRLLQYGLAFAFIGMLPAIFLPNHFFSFYWYLPSIGVWLWVSQLALLIRNRLTPAPTWRRQALSALLFVLIFIGAVLPNKKYRSWALSYTREYGCRFMTAIERVRNLPPLDASGVLVIDGMPRGLAADNISNLYYMLHGVRPRDVRVVSFID